ncbi:type VI secretion system baseplate subunit TssK [Helicobacter kayseriensis]|uniref:type VI secretion system baseplate subunit TssK n=1 Tax=Helicobacter kayseriensis TaxID=2905877 RepID=UPI001E61C6CB|nr:type VI secretion system baseplate subunit TssK [Helicobacter kayseriensis]MCE3047616.1 type VI secretion system baseplate subunit TssK [Helicobacter kayseriensis]MCE3049032.1 type VI secretion system baseplate subunit TssK [Helicobacter kayseriensis]
MINHLKIAWSNGINIDRVHFEQQERYFEHTINYKTIQTQDNLFGILHCSFNQEMLRQGKIALDYISGVAQDGSVFNAPNDDRLPDPLEVNPSIMQDSIVALKIPISVDTIADMSIQNSLPDTRYIVSTTPIGSKVFDDTNTNFFMSNEEKALHSSTSQEQINVFTASLRLSLGFLGSKNSNELEIPICKIKTIGLNGNITLDEKFIPTTLNISTHPIITNFLEEIVYSTNQYYTQLVEGIKDVSKAKTSIDFSSFAALGVLKKWNILFSYLKHKTKIHPEFFYQKLIEFQADLYGINFKLEEKDFIAYNHLDISSSIITLIDHTKFLFSQIATPKYISATTTSNGHGFYLCSFDNLSIIQQSSIYFAISSPKGTAFIQQHFQSQSKVTSEAMIRQKISSQSDGIGIEMLSIVPPILPHLNDFVYYKIDKNDPLYHEILGDSRIAFYISNIIDDPEIKMWAIPD